MDFTLMDLPFPKNALEPSISEKTVSYHYGKHHKGYVDKLNKELKKPENERFQSCSLKQLVLDAHGKIYNLAAQVWNHDFYWQSLQPSHDLEPSQVVQDALVAEFGSVDGFKQSFKEAASNQFGSGWAWLVRDAEGVLTVTGTTDAVNPLSEGKTPIVTLDVWEHAYYLDYQNDRGSYIDAFLEKLINWRFLEKNLQK